MTTPQDITEAVLRASTADGCVAVVAEHTETNLRWAMNGLTTNGQMRTRSVTVVSTYQRSGGTSAGVVTRSVASLEEIDDLVRASEAAGRESEPAEDASPLVVPAETDSETDSGSADASDWTAEPVQTSVAVFADLAAALGTAFTRWRDAGRLLYGFAEHQLTSYFVASSTGLRRRFDQPDGRLEINAKSADLTGSAWFGMHTRDFRDVDIDGVTADLAQRLDWAATTIDLPPGRYETILPPTAVADLMIEAYWAASARDAEEGRSVYAASGGGTRIGEQLCPLPVTMRSDPDEPGLECPPFVIATSSAAGIASVFDNGAPAPATTWLTNGALTELIRTRAWATQTAAAPRPMIDNLIIESSDDGGSGRGASLAEMIASTRRGLLLTCLWYIRQVDPQTLLLTGLTRDGVYLIEDGEVRGAVNNFRFNESPIDLLSRVSEIGATSPTLSREWSDYFSRTAMPPMRIPDFNMSTVSRAS